MDGSSSYYSEEQMSQVLQVAEALQDENERLRTMNEESELKICELTQRHLSETRGLMSQISLMKLTIADLGQQLREKDAEIVRLNEKIGTYSESDIILNRNYELQERVKEVTKWSDEQIKKSKQRLARAKQAQEQADQKNRKADGKLRDFNKHLRTEAMKIQSAERAKAEKKYREESELYKAKLDLWTAAIAAVLLAQMLGDVIMYSEIRMDILEWFGGVGKLIVGFFYLHYEALNVWGGGLNTLIGSGIVAGVIAFILLAAIVTFLFAVSGAAYDRWSQMWLWYRNNKVDDIRRAVTVGIVAVSATVAVALRESLSPPLDFNWMNWWIVFSVTINYVYHTKFAILQYRTERIYLP